MKREHVAFALFLANPLAWCFVGWAVLAVSMRGFKYVATSGEAGSAVEAICVLGLSTVVPLGVALLVCYLFLIAQFHTLGWVCGQTYAMRTFRRMFRRDDLRRLLRRQNRD